jgi:hypothetical protein
MESLPIKTFIVSLSLPSLHYVSVPVDDSVGDAVGSWGSDAPSVEGIVQQPCTE